MDMHQRLADERHQQLMTAITGIHDRLDLLNGRTRMSEITIATLTERVDNLRPSKAGGIAGSIGGVIAGIITAALNSFLK